MLNIEDSDLQKIAKLAHRQQSLLATREQLEGELKQVSVELREVSEKLLPEAMDEVGLEKFTLSDGTTISIAEIVSAGLPTAGGIERARGEKREVLLDRLSQALVWLEGHGAGDLIKNEVRALFGRGEDDEAEALAAFAAQHGYSYTQSRTVHPQTLGAFCREQLESGADLPMDLLGVHIVRRAKVATS